MKLRTRLNVTYAAVQAIFWVVCCPIVGFGSAYLLERGFSSVDIGVMLGVANVLSMVVQPLLSARSDADVRFSPLHIVIALTASMLASSAIQAALMPTGPLMAVLWTFSATCAISANVFVTAVKFQIDEQSSIDFGTCRAAGSLAWGSLSAGLGFAIERFGMRLVPTVVCVASVAFLALLLACERRGGRADSEGVVRLEAAGEASTWGEFIRANPWLMVMLAGISLVYLHHALSNYFSAVVVENVGGDNSDMGLIIALSAVLEMPAMVLSSRLERRLGTRPVLAFSLVMFTAKAIALWRAATVAQLTGAFSIQLLCYGFFTASSVSFADGVVRPCDLVKAQACFTLVTTLSAIFSSFVGGVLFDLLGGTPTLLCMAVAAVVGVVVSLVSMFRIKVPCG